MPFPIKYSDITMSILLPEIASTSVWYNFIYHTSIDCAGQQKRLKNNKKISWSPSGGRF